MVAIKSITAIAALSLVNTAQAWYNDLPSCLSPFDPFVYTGCYDNGQTGQKEALTLRTDLDQQNMTVATCVSHCKVSTALLPEDQCTFPCTGNSSETCGGDTEINIWMDPTFPPLADQTDVSEYVPVGCWTDEATEGKALFYRQDSLDSSTMTTKDCLQSCLSGGFPFAGTEYGGECYCGVVVGNGTALATDASTCNMPCNGNSDETCGGPSRLSLYVAKDLESLEPCGTPPDTSSTITTPPATSTKPPTTSSTTTAPVCTTTTVTPSKCEYKVGKWCSNPVPEWKDKSSCLVSFSQCLLQSTSCFLKAGLPDALSCFQYTEWCTALDLYCLTKCVGTACDKPTFIKKSPPKGGNPPTTQTSTTACPTTVVTTTKTKTTTTPAPTSSCPVPTPTGICTQPTNKKYGYAPGKPVGGIPLPIVTCNNIKNDWNNGNVFKMYTDQNSQNCPTYTRPKCSSACVDACKTQFQQCESVYTDGCKKGLFNSPWKDADAACQAQYNDCLTINKNVKGDGKCTTWTC
ncbi:hypothetical protein E0Z10_g7326 [Xylaria hypoxylon]|uniref:WSC domain-containing protein n=1 Tax=Xylaria hypoxylon TaxID=37992 RepID=A0A4Z0YQY3_9PEZI|nr:hypothetical protein E0Z10_g7326 [Xylaria hypoxylon]